MKTKSPKPSTQEPVLVYQTEDGLIRVDVRMDGETVWLSQEQISQLFERERSVITKHIRNALAEGELDDKSNVQNLHIPNSDKPVKFYNLDAIIAVGYRVKSKRGTQFRIWATQRLREYITKGFALDDKRLKESSYLDRYFDELTERIRDIRISERQFYRKVADIYATSIDYDPKADLTQSFYATVQNKFHYAITGKTAAELIASRANVSQPNMGLTNWPGERILARDVTIAKNYLSPEELSELGSVVEQYLIFAERQAKSRIAMHMADWIEKLHGFLSLNDKAILQDAGKLSKQMADEMALKAYEKYRTGQRMQLESLSDFDVAINLLSITTKPAVSRINKDE